MNSIELESKINIKNILDVDNFRSRYYDNYKNLYVEFPGFELSTLEKNICFLYNNCTIEEFKEKWYMRPDYTSYDFYNTVIYWPIILYINNINSIEEYCDLEEVLIPSLSSILEISRDRMSTNLYISTQEQLEEETANMYYKRFPFDKIEIQMIENINRLMERSEDSISTSTLVENIEEFVLSAEDISNKYVLLMYPPVNLGSVFLYLEDLNYPQPLGYDYMLLTDSESELKKISWANDDCEFGDGMEGLLEENNKIRIKYIYSNLNSSE